MGEGHVLWLVSSLCFSRIQVNRGRHKNIEDIAVGNDYQNVTQVNILIYTEFYWVSWVHTGLEHNDIYCMMIKLVILMLSTQISSLASSPKYQLSPQWATSAYWRYSWKRILHRPVYTIYSNQTTLMCSFHSTALYILMWRTWPWTTAMSAMWFPLQKLGLCKHMFHSHNDFYICSTQERSINYRSLHDNYTNKYC